MDYNLQIPDIYVDTYSTNNTNYILNIIDVDLEELYESCRIYFNTSKSIFILIKTNIEDTLLYVSDTKIYNNLIYFPDEKKTYIKMFYNSNLDYNNHFIKIYNIEFANPIKRFIQLNEYNYDTYCTGDEKMLIFKKSNIMTFTIHINHINLYDLQKKYSKFDKNKLKTINRRSPSQKD